MKSILTTLFFLIFVISSCSSIKENKRTAIGAGAGTAVGAGIGGYAGSRMDKQAKELEKVAETKRTDQGLVTKLKSDILFDTGKANLKAGAKENLKNWPIL